MKVFFSGIGGSGIYKIAELFLEISKASQEKIEVLGSDIKKSENTRLLEKLGAKIFYKQESKNISKDIDLLVYSAAIPLDNPELVEADKLKISKVESAEILRIINLWLMENLDEKDAKDFIKKYYQLQKVNFDFNFWPVLFELFDKVKREELGEIIRNVNFTPLYQIDWSQFKVIGVSGTDGKTTVSTMIYHYLKGMHKKVALISTVSALIFDGKKESELASGLHVTTPVPQQLYEVIKNRVEGKVDYLIIETTSHGLARDRVAGVKYDVMVYTNITNEHLDYHKTWENYAFSKFIAIKRNLKPNAKVVLNLDDKMIDFWTRYHNYLLDSRKDIELWTYSGNEDRKGQQVEQESEKVLIGSLNQSNNSSLSVNLMLLDQQNNQFWDKTSIKLPLIGQYNLWNYLAAFLGTLAVLDKEEELYNNVKLIESFKTVKGRMTILQDKPFTIIVDFAHTDNSLKEALKSMRQLLDKKEKGRLIVVFGCAGLRDQYKRPAMGRWANKYADIIILTAEDSRTESLYDINNQILSGMAKIKQEKQLSKVAKHYLLKNGKEVYSFFEENTNSRSQALDKALTLAKPGDIVIATGKGHEQSLCFGYEEYDWNDIEYLKKRLAK